MQQHLCALSFRDPPTPPLTPVLSCRAQLGCLAQQFGSQSTFPPERTELGSLASYRNLLYSRKQNQRICIGPLDSWGGVCRAAVCSGQVMWTRILVTCLRKFLPDYKSKVDLTMCGDCSEGGGYPHSSALLSPGQVASSASFTFWPMDLFLSTEEKSGALGDFGSYECFPPR